MNNSYWSANPLPNASLSSGLDDVCFSEDILPTGRRCAQITVCGDEWSPAELQRAAKAKKAPLNRNGGVIIISAHFIIHDSMCVYMHVHQ